MPHERARCGRRRKTLTISDFPAADCVGWRQCIGLVTRDAWIPDYTSRMSAHACMLACVGCGAVVPDIDGPVHRYIGASPGCWAVYCDVLAREYGELRNPPWHRLTVDAYAAQHPGLESRRSIQSVAVHLISLHLVFNERLDPSYVTRRLAAIVGEAGSYRWLEPPTFSQSSTVLDVAATATASDHERAVKQWARDVWAAWSEHHATIRAWAGKSR